MDWQGSTGAMLGILCTNTTWVVELEFREKKNLIKSRRKK